MQPKVADFKEGRGTLQNQEVSCWNLHTHYFPHLPKHIPHYYTGSLGKVSNSHTEPIQYPEKHSLFLALLNSNQFPNPKGYLIFNFDGSLEGRAVYI
jgi:hypothetical protein